MKKVTIKKPAVLNGCLRNGCKCGCGNSNGEGAGA